MIGLLFLMMGGMLSGARPVIASAPKMDYWFIETLTVDDVELPAGVVIRTTNTGTQSRGCLILENQTETLLFVLSLNYKSVLVMETPDPDWKSRVNMAHEVASYLVAPGRPACLNMEALSDLDRNLVDRNVLTFDSPPADLAIPVVQTSELLLVYGEQVILVPFMLTYGLNANFDNGSGVELAWKASVQATGNASASATREAEAYAARVGRNTTLVAGLMVAAVLLFTGWLVWRGKRRL
ncbi:MAG: hypothetical protein A2030_04720 [Chloroflexi bacterium RBG_19FT_COMBO_50_10]|nr:MAG: hypothetical protein A2030_04720 [Chloroflexi bacterium RBG_19FT_COMBO_50_10]